MKYFLASIFFYVSSVMATQGPELKPKEYERVGQLHARRCLCNDIRDQIEWISSELSYKENHKRLDKEYYFYKGAYDFYNETYSYLVDD